MAAKHISPLAALAALLFAVSACVYPFEPEIGGEDGRLVVEGDIHVGSVSTFNFSRVYPLDLEDYTPEPVNVTGYIEGEDGVRVEGSGNWTGAFGTSSLVFDTSKLSAAQRYRLHFTESTSGGLEYESDWIEVCPAPTVDDLTYIFDEEHGELDIALSMHCDGRSHFRWHYDEEWEYHTRAKATHYYDTRTNQVVEFPEHQNTFNCWSTYHSPVIKIFSTADQTEDRFVDLQFHRIERHDMRLSVLYHIIVYLEALNEEAYKYWQNIEQNSQGQGDLFSPTPSQMKGNIRCLSDPSVDVVGYINASEQAVTDMFYNDMEEKFYRPASNESMEILEIKNFEFATYYAWGYRPLTVIEEIGGSLTYQWVPSRCVDCRDFGGTKNKPEGWPTESE